MQRNQVFSLFAVYHTSRLCGSAAYEQDEKRFFLGGRSPPRPSRGWGHRETGFPHTPAGRGRGETRFPHAPLREPRFTSAVHAAPPHTDGMKKGSSWEGVALPNPPRGRGLGARASGTRPRGRGETRFPRTPLREPMFTLAVHAIRAHRPMNIAWERGRPARVASPRESCPRSQEKCEQVPDEFDTLPGPC